MGYMRCMHQMCRAYAWIFLILMVPQCHGSVCALIFSNIQPGKYLKLSIVCFALKDCRSAKALGFFKPNCRFPCLVLES